MHLYRVVIGTYHLGLVAAHSEEEAINTAVHNVFERLAYEREVASAELIKASMFGEPTMII